MDALVEQRAGSRVAGQALQRHRPAIVAIPANNEAERIGACLAALAIQRDAFGAPLPIGAFEIIVLANNCIDDTVAVARHWSEACPHRVWVVEQSLPPAQAHAGGARKRAMDLAADRLALRGDAEGVILTTDADSCVAPTWVSATMQAFARGVDAVAGYVDAHAAEIVALGPAFLRRGRLEDAYLSAIAEIEALCDPLAYDPWPNHRVSSGASLAVSLPAYRAIGGLPPRPLGEDVALTQALAEAGFKVRHAMDVCVATSCRFDGRAPGGAADTMRLRHGEVEAPCDADMAPASVVLRRAVLRGRLRQAFGDPARLRALLEVRLGSSVAAAGLAALGDEDSFPRFWRRLEAACPALGASRRLRPSDLPAEIERAGIVLRRLRARALRLVSGGPAGRSPRAGCDGSIPPTPWPS